MLLSNVRERAENSPIDGPKSEANIAGGSADHDPMGEDAAGDPRISMTERILRRIVTLAADTGTRFEREGIPHDPVAWMLAPRRLFDGQRPIDAARDLELFCRGLVFHRASNALDGDPLVYADILRDDVARLPPPGRVYRTERSTTGQPALHTCYLDLPDDAGQALWALMARDEQEARERAIARFGEDDWDSIEVERGFEPDHPVAVALVAEGVELMLCRAMLDPERAAAAGFEVFLDMRCAA